MFSAITLPSASSMSGTDGKLEESKQAGASGQSSSMAVGDVQLVLPGEWVGYIVFRHVS